MSFCNGANFFNAALRMERAKRLDVPLRGMSRNMVATAGSLGTGRECPTTRNFDMVDQDPSSSLAMLGQNRLASSFGNLNLPNFGLQQPIASSSTAPARPPKPP